MKRVLACLIASIILMVSPGCDLNDEDDEGVLIESSLALAGIKELDIVTVSGDCTVQPAADDTLRVELSYTFPETCFEPRYLHEGNELELKEYFPGESCTGNSHWVITLPTGVDVEFASASGSFTLAEYTGELDVATASGLVTVADVTGELDLSSASGNVTVDGVVFTGASVFSSASGNVLVVVDASPEYDLELNSASGDAVVNYSGNEVQGYFEFTALQDGGEISSPYEFDSEVTYTEWGHVYMRKSFTRGQGTPRVTVGTASGIAELKLN
ncbi:MAG: DUF4097 family beta strand repeat protein [Fidelibacterota bacterium]|nr:MAG: DUF4097 family beta strand repeat protein [Candidatus Neomarinimicrobiota bacterium]